MLTEVLQNSPQDWLKTLKNFNPETGTWVVADLKAKLEVQQELFKTHKVLPEESVLRASELWLHIYKSLGIDTKIISQAFAKAFLIEQLEAEEEAWLKVPGAHKTLFEYVRQLFPLIIYPEAEDLIKPWWAENTGPLMRWGRWFFYAKKYVNLFLEQGWILQNWVPYILNNDYAEEISWNRNLYIDLGSQLTQSEAVIIKSLSESIDCNLLYPTKIGSSEFLTIDRVYSRVVELKENESNTIDFKNIEFKRFSASLGEVKDMCGQVRQWLNEGVKLSDIAVLLPDIEVYWPVLSSYLAIENIPVQKKKVIRAQSFLPIMSWLAKLKIELGKVSSDDLELEIFSDQEGQPIISHVDFKKIYSLILNDDQIHRLKKVSGRYNQKINPQQKMSAEEFFVWSIQFFKEESSLNGLDQLLKALLRDSVNNIRLQAKTWLSFLEDIAAQTEISVQDEVVGGILVENIRSARNFDVKYVYVMGMSESQIKNRSIIGVSSSEVFKIENDLGFVLDLPENQELEFDADWLLSMGCSEMKVSFAETNFSGEPDSASMLWLKAVKYKGLEFDHVNIPKLSYWDYKQQTIQNDLEENKARFISRDQGDFVFPLTPYRELKKLSVSRLQRYSKCPFIYLAESLYKLKDPESLDLDLDPMARGQLLHKVLQNALEEPFKKIWDEAELVKLIDLSRKEIHLQFYDERSWFRIRSAMLQTLKRFIEFEVAWREDFPKTKTIGKEVELKTIWDQDAVEFLPIGNDGIEFRGSIDRVDTDSGGHAVVLDYKSSASQIKNYNSWLDNDQLQLSVYGYLVQKGFTELKPLEVLGMGYYLAKEFERNKGLWCEEADGELFNINKRSRNSMSKLDLEDYWGEVKVRIHELVAEMQKGKMSPEPKDKRDCDNCSWRSLCRAPHLN